MTERAPISACIISFQEEDRIGTAQEIFKLRQRAAILLQNPSVYANCLLSVNGRTPTPAPCRDVCRASRNGSVMCRNR